MDATKTFGLDAVQEFLNLGGLLRPCMSATRHEARLDTVAGDVVA